MGRGCSDIDGSGGASSFRQWVLTLDGRVEVMNAAARVYAERLGPRDALHPLQLPPAE